MVRVIRSPVAKRNIYEALKYTKEHWGEAQARQYAELIKEAELAISRNPRRGRSYSSVRPGIFGYHIGKPGRPARHILFYRIVAADTIEVVRLLHDSMDFGNRLQFAA
ncbi:type II toxin-antitoxin system RelE/ParE family toxin [Sorangium sp. So ce1151]|uniref:type II toxin-antitoxin system RelE/ParE family toxin n=1 Tax=Sorangium sp. So ce1151 TaxID=3133332 RepID=UPI003F5ED461